MTLDRPRVSQNLKDFDFRRLFTQELGWDHHRSTVEVTVEGQSFTLTAVAEKRGMVAFNCAASDAEGIPPYALRRKVERQVSKSAHEHLIIFTDQPKTTQVWQWVKREVGRPTACREHAYHRSQSGEALIQKLESLEISLEEEENLTVVDVAGRARAAFDVDRITKRFYDRFKTEHAAFLKFIKGIPSEDDQAWYASLMLNRLMFVYFIQKKGFLDNDPDYLRNRMLAMQQQHGKDKFYSFYRQFLLRLFHEGLNQPLGNRAAGLDALIGAVPYLNGGLFDVHRLEERNPEIAIPDKAFQRLFDFFDAYQWHLDERPLRADNEINPDVLGYIFEKYINQKQMGAYYTKEDITGYIAQNTVIPFLFDAAEKKCPAAFKPSSPTWRLLRDDPDRYIFTAVRHGVDAPLPKAIAAGLENVSKREGWNQAAPDEFALPTETWREHVARRNRCQELRRRLTAGELHSINDLITLNLDVRQFAQDVIENCETPELLRALYKAICSVSVLDPTCGSGAFLFAALNVLEPLYEACLERMQAFLEESALPAPEPATAANARPTSVGSPDTISASWVAAEETIGDDPRSPAMDQAATKPGRSKQFSDFRRILTEVAKHPSPRYFILKSIIIGNLYGVDIMEEAVEICKLRLFLKLVAQVERVDQVEPLPDVDFNIRAGNTLVGYVSLAEIRHAIERERGGQKKLAFSDAQEEIDAIEEKAEIADRAYQRFREMQTEQGMDASLFTEAKRELRRRLDSLAQELDRYLAGDYGIPTRDREGFSSWRSTHQPFHWFAEFFGIMRQGGFSAVIGNPPYVEWSKVTNYTLSRGCYETIECGNVYTAICERCYSLLLNTGRFGMIVPVSCISTDRMAPFRSLWWNRKLATHVSLYSGDAHPSILFQGVKFRLAILLQTPDEAGPRVWSTHFYRWWPGGRESLFSLLEYTAVEQTFLRQGLVPKIACGLHAGILDKLCRAHARIGDRILRDSDYPVYCHRIVAHFVKAFDFIPYFRNDRDGVKKSEDYKIFAVANAQEREVLSALLNSNLVYSWFVTYSDVYHFGRDLILDFPCDLVGLASERGKMLKSANSELMRNLRSNSVRRRIPYRSTGIVEYDEFYPRLSKRQVDQIDWILADFFGLTADELDFIVNYDIKFRMAQDGGDDEE